MDIREYKWDSTFENIGRHGMHVYTREVDVEGYSGVDILYDFEHSPTGNSVNADILRRRLGIQSCTYMFFKNEDYHAVGTDLPNSLVGYIGETGNFVNRMNDIKMSFQSPRYSVYHGLGRYLRRNNIRLNSLVCRVIPTRSKYEALEIERHLQSLMKFKHGFRFAWEDGASSGRGSAIHKALDMIECINDPKELDTIMQFIKSHRKSIK